MKKTLFLILALVVLFPFSTEALSKQQRAKVALIGGAASLLAGVTLMYKNGTVKIPDFENDTILSWYPETENSWIVWGAPGLAVAGIISLLYGLNKIEEEKIATTTTNDKHSNTDLICHGSLNVNGPVACHLFGPNVDGSPNIPNYE